MAAARPVLAAAVGGICEIITNQKDGLLFKGGDSNDLAQKLQRLLADVSLRELLGQEGIQTVAQKFTLEKQTIAIKNIYQEIL